MSESDGFSFNGGTLGVNGCSDNRREPKKRVREIKKLTRPKPLNVSLSSRDSHRSTPRSISNSECENRNEPVSLDTARELIKDVKSQLESLVLRRNVYADQKAKDSVTLEDQIWNSNKRTSILFNKLQQISKVQVPNQSISKKVSEKRNLQVGSVDLQNKSYDSLNTDERCKNVISEVNEKSQVWSLSNKIWPINCQIPSTESLSLSLMDPLIVTYSHSGLLCATKESVSYASHQSFTSTTSGYSQSPAKEKLNPGSPQISKNPRGQNQHLCKDKHEALKPGSNHQANKTLETVENESKTESDTRRRTSKMFAKLKKMAAERKSDSFSETGQSDSSIPQTTPDPTSLQPSAQQNISDEQKVISFSVSNSNEPNLEKTTSLSSAAHPNTPNTVQKPSAVLSELDIPTLDKLTYAKNRLRDVKKCFNCGSVEHLSTECPEPSIGKFCSSCGWENVTKERCRLCSGKSRKQHSNGNRSTVRGDYTR
ncbi:uncharacterized protein LOC106640440 isoform X1 [Copidosoma floridanum]|uniref:uncharacterized protein LOC106640440 isoform X1 n=1 Tax=Copidosoma floridanum TaxID=29053 RepID=UPI0006C9D2C3|nr:uncharacterized protein LOC106640440 isoform X1 [Copidosoma floridanum]